MPAPLADVPDVASRWPATKPPLTDAQSDLAAVYVEEASSLIRLRIPDVEARAAASSDYAFTVKAVIARSVLRTLLNPEGKSEEQIDDYRYRRASAVADGSLYISPADFTLLGAAPVQAGAFTIRPRGAGPVRAVDGGPWV